jgi:hypothetical protein
MTRDGHDAECELDYAITIRPEPDDPDTGDGATSKPPADFTEPSTSHRQRALRR